MMVLVMIDAKMYHSSINFIQISLMHVGNQFIFLSQSSVDPTLVLNTLRSTEV